jgi:hypothetical protein
LASNLNSACTAAAEEFSFETEVFSDLASIPATDSTAETGLRNPKHSSNKIDSFLMVDWLDLS